MPTPNDNLPDTKQQPPLVERLERFAKSAPVNLLNYAAKQVEGRIQLQASYVDAATTLESLLPEILSTLRAQSARIAELEGALEAIRDYEWPVFRGDDDNWCRADCDSMKQMAYAALTPPSAERSEG